MLWLGTTKREAGAWRIRFAFWTTVIGTTADGRDVRVWWRFYRSRIIDDLFERECDPLLGTNLSYSINTNEPAY
jgi:hypothetical protein